MPGILGIAEVAPRLRVALANVYHTGHGEGGGSWTDDLDDALREANRDALSAGSALILVQHPWIAPDFVPEGGDEDAGCIGGAATAARHPPANALPWSPPSPATVTSTASACSAISSSSTPAA